MDPMTIAALANVALQVGGQLLNKGSQSSQMGIQERALADQQRNAKEQMKLATATQTDPYGNKLIYTPGIGWHYDLTQQQQGLNAAARGEQLKGLTEDATRNRQARERAEGRAMEGEQDWYRTLNEIRYGQQPSEASSIADLTRLGILGYERGAREGANNIGRQAIRGLANPNVLASIQRRTQEDLGGRLEEAMLKGRSAGKAEHRADLASRQQELGGWLGKYGDIANSQTQTGNIAMPSAAGDLGAPNVQSIIQALQNAASGNRAALTSLASASGKPGFDLGALGPSILALGKQLQPGSNPADPSSWSVSTTPNQQWAGQYDVYGNPYPWAIAPEEDEETRGLGDING